MNKSESKYFNTAVKMDKALIEILGIKDFEYITVKEICNKAGVNRSTFYLHYENIGDLLEETTKYLLDGFLAYFTGGNEIVCPDFSTCELSELNFITEEYMLPYLTYIKENKVIFATAVSHSASFGFDKVYQRMFEHIFNPILNRFSYPESERKYIMAFYLNGINAVVVQWLKDGCDKSVNEVSGIIHKSIFGAVDNM